MKSKSVKKKTDDAELGILFVCRCHLHGIGEGRDKHRDEILSEGCGRTIRQPSNTFWQLETTATPSPFRTQNSVKCIIFSFYVLLVVEEFPWARNKLNSRNWLLTFVQVLFLKKTFFKDVSTVRKLTLL